MDFEAWTNPAVDRTRQKRLLVGSVFGALTILSTFAALAMSSKGAAEEIPEEEALDVELAKEPEPEPQAEPEPEPEPEPQPQQTAPRVGPVMPALTTPTEIPSDAPSEKAVDPNDNPYASGDPYMFGSGATGGTGRATVAAPVKVEAVKPVEAPRPAGPQRVDADTTPPKPLGGGGAAVYPAEAKAAGIEGVVIVKFVVTEAGEVTQVKAVKGPEELRPSCEEYVKGMKFSPAIRDGAPVAVHQVKPCRFKLGT